MALVYARSQRKKQFRPVVDGAVVVVVVNELVDDVTDAVVVAYNWRRPIKIFPVNVRATERPRLNGAMTSGHPL